jgi:hypothetical protein
MVTRLRWAAEKEFTDLNLLIGFISGSETGFRKHQKLIGRQERRVTGATNGASQQRARGDASGGSCQNRARQAICSAPGRVFSCLTFPAP